jgi:flagellar L-ring protein precursor FlgH
VGDIITVEIVENASAKKKADSKAERKNEFEAGISSFLGYSMKDLPLVKTPSDPEKLIAANFKSKHDTKAELKKEDNMTASIGCTVVEVSYNGNLSVRGSREIMVNGETQYIVLQGTARTADITSSNTVLSTQLADVKIFYTGRGVLSDKQKPGWLSRLLDNIWPF